MAYADCFMLIGLALTLAIPGVFLLSRARPGEGGAAH